MTSYDSFVEILKSIGRIGRQVTLEPRAPGTAAGTAKLEAYRSFWGKKRQTVVALKTPFDNGATFRWQKSDNIYGLAFLSLDFVPG